MKIETTLNQIPSLTWNWLKMNRGELKLETSLADEIKAEITGISEQISYEYKSSIDIPTMEEGLGKETDFMKMRDVNQKQMNGNIEIEALDKYINR